MPPGGRIHFVREGGGGEAHASVMLVSSTTVDYDLVHVNAESADQASDHDLQIACLDLRG
jgi:uncharacterized protein